MGDMSKTTGEKTSRGKWDNQREFVLSLFGYTVGIGNLVRFPYFCFANGGGAFLIPFFLVHIFCGIPLYQLELFLGQFSGLSPTEVWNLSPLFKGLGYSMAATCAVVSIYYNMLIAYCLFYLIASFCYPLPWQSCDNWWNTERCWDGLSPFNTRLNSTANMSDTNQTTTFVWASDEYFHRRVLKMSDSMEQIGAIRWELVGCSAGAWLITFLCLAWGVKGTGKVVYVTATLPCFLLLALIIRGTTLPGAESGLFHYAVPDFNKLLDPQTWLQAYLSMIYSLGPTWGSVITLASYSSFRHKCNREGIAMPFADMTAAVLSGVAIFSVLGFMATETSLGIGNVVSSGPGLSYVVYPLALGHLPWASVWSIIFFLTGITLGLDTMFGIFETVISGVLDSWPMLRKRSSFVVAGACFLFFLVNIVFCTEGGMFYYQITDWYCTVFTLPLVAFLEVVAVILVYGTDRFSNDVRLMLGKPPGFIMKALWYISIPLLGLVLIGSLFFLRPPSYGKYEYPDYIHTFGLVFISLPSALPIPLTAIWVLIKTKPEKWPYDRPGSFVDRLWFNLSSRIRKAVKPNSKWKPQEETNVESFAETNDMTELSIVNNRKLNHS